jgi:hypothetical protein
MQIWSHGRGLTVGHVDEEAVVDDTNHVLEGLGGSTNILDVLLELDVNDVVSVVGHSRLVALNLVVGDIAGAEASNTSSKLRQSLDGAKSVQVAERSDLDRESEGGSKALAKLGVVDDADELLGHNLDHLLTEQSATAALDQGQIRINSISAVDGDVQLALLVEGDKRNLCMQQNKLVRMPDRGNYKTQLPNHTHADGLLFARA